MKLHTLLLSLLVACGGPSKPQVVSTGTGPDSALAPSTIEVPPEQVEGTSPYPPTARGEVVQELHGTAVSDPYRWLENVEDPKVQQWMTAQDDQTRTALTGLPHREALQKRFTELYYLDSVSAPRHRGGRYFYSRRHKDQEKSIYYWKKGAKGAEQVLFDPNAWSKDGSVAFGGSYASWNGKLVAYKRKENNADEATLYVRNVDTGKDSELDVIAGVNFSEISWTPNNKGFYYTQSPVDPSIPVADRPGHAVVKYHKVGTDPAKDELVFPRTADPRTFIGAEVTRDGRWLVLHKRLGWSDREIYVKDLRRKSKKVELPTEGGGMSTEEWFAKNAEARGFVPLAVGMKSSFDVQWWRGSFYILTDYQAPNYHLFKVNPRKLAFDQWEEIVPESKATMEDLGIVGNKLVLNYLRNASSEMEIRDLNGKLVRKVELPGIGSSSSMLGNPDEDEAYYGFSSYTAPPRIFKTSIKSGKTELWWQAEIPADVSNMTAEQVWYDSKDGTKVSMFVLHNKEVKLDGTNPTILYGYGGFNVKMRPSFNSTAVAWLERGGVYAIANLRGGGEYGESWHKAGMLANKQNVFDDFIAAGEFLIAKGFTSADKLAIYGGSNGGLLVGAAMTQRPELFRVVLCAVPLLDMVRYHMFGLGQAWIPEYGSAEDPEQFKTLLDYSPYHHVVKDTAYPAMLMLSADSDDRVDPLHARKFTAAVQWATTSADRPVLMRIERNAGHGGADMRKMTVERSADMLAFVMWQLGM